MPPTAAGDASQTAPRHPDILDGAITPSPREATCLLEEAASAAQAVHFRPHPLAVAAVAAAFGLAAGAITAGRPALAVGTTAVMCLLALLLRHYLWPADRRPDPLATPSLTSQWPSWTVSADFIVALTARDLTPPAWTLAASIGVGLAVVVHLVWVLTVTARRASAPAS